MSSSLKVSVLVQKMRFFVLSIAYFLDENRMPRVESRFWKATHSDNCPHDESVFSRLLFYRINFLGNTFRLAHVA